MAKAAQTSKGQESFPSLQFSVFTCCLTISVGRTAVFDSATSDMFNFFITSMNITSKCIVTGELLNMEKGLSLFFLNDTHLPFNFTTAYYKLCFNGTGVLINPDQSVASFVLPITCFPRYLPVSQ